MKFLPVRPLWHRAFLTCLFLISLPHKLPSSSSEHAVHQSIPRVPVFSSQFRPSPCRTFSALASPLSHIHFRSSHQTLAQSSNLRSTDTPVNVIQENQTQDSKNFSDNSSHASFPQKPDPPPESSNWVKKIPLFSITLSPTLGSYSFVSLSGPMCYETHQLCLFWNVF